MKRYVLVEIEESSLGDAAGLMQFLHRPGVIRTADVTEWVAGGGDPELYRAETPWIDLS